MSYSVNPIKKSPTLESKDANKDAINKYADALKKWNKGMKQYNDAQDTAKNTGGFAIQGFPSKPQLEWYLPGGTFGEEDE
jgi:hypothetical protein